MDYALPVVLVLIFAVGIPFTLWWWKMADRWADAEHKRFKPRSPSAPVERVVIRNPSSGGEAGRDA